jgi:hypothetical protein
VGEKQNRPFQLAFNASLKVDFQVSRVTSDGGLIMVRELDERLGLGALIAQHLTDSRRGKNTQFPLADLLRQSVDSRLAGYEDVNDAGRLSQDPTLAMSVGKLVEKAARARRGVCGAEGKRGSSGFGLHERCRMSPLGSDWGRVGGKNFAGRTRREASWCILTRSQ